MWYLWLLGFVLYVGGTWYSLVQSASPATPCNSNNDNNACVRPLVSRGDALMLELWLHQLSPPAIINNNDTNETTTTRRRRTRIYEWVSIETCRLNFTIPELSNTLPQQLTTTTRPTTKGGTRDINMSANKNENETTFVASSLCQVPIPKEARHRSSNAREVQPLRAKFLIRLASTGETIATVPLELTRIIQVQDTAATNNNNKIMWVPYFKYGHGRNAPVRIRFVAEYREYSSDNNNNELLLRNDGIRLPRWNRTTYAPLIYVDDLSLPRHSQIELAPPQDADNRPPVQLDIKLGTISPVVDSLIRQVQIAFDMMESIMPGTALDEFRYLLQDEQLYRFVLTQIISLIHMWLDYLAFRDEIAFYKGRDKLSGVSTSSVMSRLICDVIILLYLMDGGGTSWVVLFSLMSSCAVQAWKVWKLLRPTFQPSYPFVSIRQLPNAKEQETAEYDWIASKTLGMILYPVVLGWSIYDAHQHHEQYASWYSWLISNLANAVYMFGFISLCPQLYVNYRLKSVAHLPWKVFLYKIFNTFVDDAFAWILEMPWKHRIMTLRDDVVFILFLVQVYLYRLDKTRTNEFGYSYQEEEEQANKKEGGKPMMTADEDSSMKEKKE